MQQSLRRNAPARLTAAGIAAALAVAIGGTNCHPPTPCAVDDDCRGSHEAEEAGRCAPDVYCSSKGTCRAECLGTCAVASDGANPCTNGGVCNQAAVPPANKPKDSFVCTKRVIPCEQVSDCPAYRPGPGEWLCNSGACSFPGFSYRE